MGCFLACFGGAKDRKRRRATNRSPTIDRVNKSYKSLQPSSSPEKTTIEVADGSLPELRENQEQGNFSSYRKKVTFDLNVKTYEDILVHEDPKHLSEDDEGKEPVREEKNPEEREGKAIPSSGAYPLNHRYQNCGSSDDDDDDDYRIEGEEEDEEYEDCDFDDEEDDVEVGIEGNEEESYDSYFSLPMEKERQRNFQEVSSPKPNSASSPDREPAVSGKGNARDRSQYVHSVLNPVENLSQWKEIKVRGAPLKIPNKENINSELETKMMEFSPEPPFKIDKPQKPLDSNPEANYSTKQEILVDASLSTWLVSSESSPKEKGPQGSNSLKSNSSVSRADRPILGALTVEDLKQSSVTSSPRRSPSRSPDEIPILGTVGSYWSSNAQSSDTKGIPNTTSKYGEDKRVNWYSTPFEVRLERALNKGAAEACPR